MPESRRIPNLFRFARVAAHGLLTAAAVLYAAAVLVLVAAWAAGAERIWWLALANVFAVLFFVPLLALVPVALAWPSRWLRGAVAVPLAIFVASFGPQVVPNQLVPVSDGNVRVATFNLFQAKKHQRELVALIRAQNADVVALQELTWPMAQAAERELSDRYPYQYVSLDTWSLGMGILSRYPLRPLPDAIELRRQRVELDVDGRTVTLVNVHLSSPDYFTFSPPQLYRLSLPGGYSPYFRDREGPVLLRELDSISGPLVVVGDFNTGERELLYDAFRQRLRDAYRETAWGFGFTYPVERTYFGVRLPLPVVRIDYIWSGGGVEPIAAHTECNTAGSDHCMVIADLRLP
jgi:endonuclease/exonuclease/phosphatase (EEP) superfamily protein YafD